MNVKGSNILHKPFVNVPCSIFDSIPIHTLPLACPQQSVVWGKQMV
ncbi:Uncharacterised protein [Mycobacteroides abscessus subsp. abscessus]|nr:Uncharacterised protein [Mycobacteroides abscessus subsp. abscessus]